MATQREILAALRRSRTLAGGDIDPDVAEAIVRGGLKAESDRALQSRGIALQERSLDESVRLKEQELEQQELAGKIGAGVQIGALGLQHFQNKRALEVASTRGLQLEALFRGTTPGAITEGKALESALGPGTAAGTTVGPSALKIGVAGVAGAVIGSQIGKGKGKTLATGIGAGIGAALVGAGPLGIAISGITSFLGADDKVICAELNRQGYISDDILALDCLYSLMWVDTPTHVGYRLLADQIVPYIRNSKCLRTMIAPLGIAWAHAMAEKVDNSVIVKYWHRYLGNILMKTITPICRWYGRRSLNG
jgi:hypothetical protein